MPNKSIDFYTKKLSAKKPFNDEDVNGLLKAYHSSYAGSTFVEYGNYLTDRGVTSYELLAETVHVKNSPFKVVDLACGDGPLSEIIARRYKNQVQILAMDMSEGELSAAKKRLKDFNNVEFALGKADDIKLESNSVDYVLCHMAFMLMRPIEPVMKEIGRVLKPGGAFAAVLGYSDGGDSEEYDKCCDIMNEVTKKYLPHFSAIKLGDKITSTRAGLNELALEARCFLAPKFDDFNLVIRDTPQKHYELFSEYYYPPFYPPEGKAEFKQKLLEYLESIKDKNGEVTLLEPLRKVTIVKK